MVEQSAALHAIVRGIVQGVGFRDFVWRRARALGLAGYVRNRREERAVEVMAEGPRSALERLEQDLKQGPPAAIVREVAASWGSPTGRYRSFEVDM